MLTTVVIAELGARWDEWANECCGPERQLIVLSQHRFEDVLTFQARIDDSLDRLRRSGVSLDRVVFLSAENTAPNVSTLLVRIDLMQRIVSKLEQLGAAASVAALTLLH